MIHLLSRHLGGYSTAPWFIASLLVLTLFGFQEAPVQSPNRKHRALQHERDGHMGSQQLNHTASLLG